MGLSDGKIGNAITKHKDTKAAKHYQKEQAYMSRKGDSICLIIQRNKKDRFTVFNADQQIRYFKNTFKEDMKNEEVCC